MNFTSPARRKLHKTPEEKPVRHPGGKYGYTCFSLTTQTFRSGGYLRAALIHWQSLIS
jgi:hypothetical protein